MKRRSLVVRVWTDNAGQLQGQVSDPFSDWRQPFQGIEELWQLMQQLLHEVPEAPATTIEDSPLPPED